MIKTLYDNFQFWSEKGSVWVYSDPHFEDSDCKLMAADWPSPQQQIDIINSMVTKNDTFICLGDVGNEEWIPKIKAGYKVLITGNHDKGASAYKRKKFLECYDVDDYDRDKEILRRKLKWAYPNQKISIYMSYEFYYPFVRYNAVMDNGMFDEVYCGPLFISDKLLLSHEPIDLPFVYNLHGHTHNLAGGAYDENHYNLCSNTIGYKPVNLGKIIREVGLKNIPNIHRITIDNATRNPIHKDISCEL